MHIHLYKLQSNNYNTGPVTYKSVVIANPAIQEDIDLALEWEASLGNKLRPGFRKGDNYRGLFTSKSLTWNSAVRYDIEINILTFHSLIYTLMSLYFNICELATIGWNDKEVESNVNLQIGIH